MISDEQIINMYWQREEEAILRTDEKYGAYCFAVSKRILDNQEDAKECINDTWLKTWHSLPPEKPAFLRAFLVKITRNLSLDRYRAEHSIKRGGDSVLLVLEELGECVSGRDSVEGHMEEKALQETIRQFVSGLAKQEKYIFIRRYFYMESTKEIAVRYAMKDSNVRKILSRTRVKLKNHLVQEGYDL